MATEAEPRNAGRRVITQEEADAIQARARPDAPPPAPRKARFHISRREALVYAFAGSTALSLGVTTAALTAPDPERDPMLKALLPEEVQKTIPGGFAYPRFRAGEFGGQFVVNRTADSYNLEEPPELFASGKFYVVKVPGSPGTVEQPSAPTGEHIIAIYQVCTHLGCLIPFVQSEERFICPCHGSTFERNSNYVRGPAGRNLDQFVVNVASDGAITVDTGTRMTGKAH